MMNKIETIVTTDFEYLRLQYLIWRCNGLQFPNKLQAHAGQVLADIIDNGNDMPLIVNCSKVTSVANYSLESVIQKLNSSRRKVFFLYSNGIGEELRNLLKEFNSIAIKAYSNTYFEKNNETENIKAETDYIIANSTDNVIGLCKSATDDEIKRIKGFLSKCFTNDDKFSRLKSTPILTNGVFNARKIISKPNIFMQTCLLLNEKASFVINNSKPLKFRIISVSLRASAFAGVIGQLNKIFVEIVDHMGPKYKLLENSKLSFDEQDFEYLFIGDFLIGGTEMKIANTYAHFKGSIIKDAIFLASLFDPKDYESDINISTLVTDKLNEINTEVEYKLFN